MGWHQRQKPSEDKNTLKTKVELWLMLYRFVSLKWKWCYSSVYKILIK